MVKLLAEHLHVMRVSQWLVARHRWSRADGAPILSTNRGYIYKERRCQPSRSCKSLRGNMNRKKFVVELLAIVVLMGGRTVQNILIDHPVCAKIETLLGNFACRCSALSGTSREFRL